MKNFKRKMPKRNKYTDDLNGFHSFVQDTVAVLFKKDVMIPAAMVEMNGHQVTMDCAPGTEFFRLLQEKLESACTCGNCTIRASKIGESWVSEYHTDAVPDIMPKPSRDPNRKEALVVVTRERGGEGIYSMAFIHRSADGAPHLESWKNDPAAAGPLLGILPTQ